MADEKPVTAENYKQAMAEVDKITPLVAHILSIHKGDGDAKDTTLALLLEHLHWQRQAGIREGASVARTIATATEAKGGTNAARTLRVLADSLDALAAKNNFGRAPFGTTGRAHPAVATA